MFAALRAITRRLINRRYPVWYHPNYRLPVTSLEPRTGLEPRRADLVAWHLQHRKILAPADLRRPTRVSYADLRRVHDDAYLQSLGHAETLAPIFGADAWDVPVDEVMDTVRLACGGTLAAARTALRLRGPTLNLLGGFHHAYRDRGAGLCPVNDIATALAVVRADGFAGQAVILDLDAHPPDGTADCLQGDESAWIGSISGSDWGELPGVDETVLVHGEDEAYLAALSAMLERMPRPDLAFVIAGGDVLADDRFGLLDLTLDGVRERDRRIAAALAGVPSVWLPGGGYHASSWRALAGTALVLANRSRLQVPVEMDPLTLHFGKVYDELGETVFEPVPWITESDLGSLGLGSHSAKPKLLGYYTTEAIEYALSQYGILEQLRRLNYRDLEVSIGTSTTGDILRITGRHSGERHLLIEAVMSKERVGERRVLFVNWLTLRHPVGRFSDKRPRLPGQEVPGLGMAREAGELMALIAQRLELEGVAFRPAHYHTAYAARSHFQFTNAARQGRFEALIRDLGGLPLLEVTTLLAEGRVRLNGAPYAWEADYMVLWLHPTPRPDPQAVQAERDTVRFEVVPVPDQVEDT